jgi:hypothetical protein
MQTRPTLLLALRFAITPPGTDAFISCGNFAQ